MEKIHVQSENRSLNSNQQHLTQDHSVRVESKRRKKEYKYKLYIPENLDIDLLITQYPLPEKIHRDQIAYILHLINSIPANINDFNLELHRGFTPINKVALRNRIHEYRKCLDYLVRTGIIIEGTSYHPGLYSRGIKFSAKYQTNAAPIYITNYPLIKSILTKKHNNDLEAEKSLSFLRDNFNEYLNINMSHVIEYLNKELIEARIKEKRRRLNSKKSNYALSVEEVIQMGFNMKYINADNLNNKGKVKIDNNTGRLHSCLVRLKKELRPFVNYKNLKLYNIDLVNSQPLLSTILLDIDLFMKNNIHALIAKYNPEFRSNIWYNDPAKIKSKLYLNNPSINLIKLIKHHCEKRDVKKYKQHVHDGTFYEEFARILKERNLLPNEIRTIDNIQLQNAAIRKFAKHCTFEALFSKPTAQNYSTKVKAFRDCFPHVYQIFTFIKRGKNRHNTLACILQRFESEMILHKTCVEIHQLYPSAILYTIHDSIVTTKENVDLVKAIFIKNVFEMLNVEPKIQVEAWE